MSAISVPTNSSPGTCLPSTTRHTVSGVAISRPSGPHSHVQNATRHEQRHLRHAGRAGIQHGFEHEVREQLEHDEQAHHPERTGPARERGQADQDRRAAPSTGPTYGMNRSAAPSDAQTSGYGTPRK